MQFDTRHGHFSYWWCNLDLKSRSIHCLRSWVTFPHGILSYCYRCFFKKYGMTQIRRFLHAPNNSLVSVGLNKSIPMPWIHHDILQLYWLQCYINAEWRHTSQISPLFGSMNEALSGRDDWPIEPVSSFLSWCTLHRRLVKWFPF